MVTNEPVHEVLARSKGLMIEVARHLYPGLFVLSRKLPPQSVFRDVAPRERHRQTPLAALPGIPLDRKLQRPV